MIDDREDMSNEAFTARAEAERERTLADLAGVRAAITERDADRARQLAGRGPGTAREMGLPKTVVDALRRVGAGEALGEGDEAATLRLIDGATEPATEPEAPAGIEASGDPLDGMVERLQRRLADPSADARRAFDEAFEPAALAAAAEAEGVDPQVFQALHRGLKSLKGFPLTQWMGAVKAEARRQKAAAKEAERELQRAAHAAQRAAEVERDAARRAELEVERDADPERRDHYADITRESVHYRVRPGRVDMSEQRADGRTVTTSLARFSPIIAEQTLTFPAPDAPPDIELRLSVCVDRDGSLRDLVLPASALESPGWMLRKLGRDGGDTGASRGAYEHLRRAMFAASESVTETHRRYGYVGWVEHGDRLVYVHAGGAIGAEGVVHDLTAVPAGPLRHFALPAPPTGVEAQRAVRAVLDLLSMEPATVMVPMVALAFHAPLGGARLAFHATGITDVGKSVRASLVQRFFGREMHHKRPPGAWTGSPAGTYPLLAGAGDAVFWIDDLTPSVPASKIEAILRAHFNESGAARGLREGGMRVLPMSRCNLLSVGELAPRGDTASTLNRILAVDLGAPLPNNAADLYARAAAGEMDTAMALYLRWLAPTIRDTREGARAEEREAAVRWGFDVRDRTADLMGGYTLGMESLLAFLDAHGVPGAVVEHHRQRAAAAFAEVARVHRVHVADDDVGRRMLDLVMDAIAAGRAHTPMVALGGVANSKRLVPPTEAHAWGYRMEGEELRPKGDCVGFHLYNKRGAVHLLPGPAVAVAMREAKMRGRELGGDVESLGKALYARGHLASTTLETSRGKLTVQARVAGGSAPETWAVRMESLVPAPDAEDPLAALAQAPAQAPAGDAGAESDPGEFLSDIDPFSPDTSGLPPP